MLGKAGSVFRKAFMCFQKKKMWMVTDADLLREKKYCWLVAGAVLV